MDWVKNFITPLVKITFLLGIISFIVYYVCKAFSNVWKKSVKWFFKYQVKRIPYPELYVEWIMKCLEQRINWYEAKKMLLLSPKMLTDEQINEILWIYMQMINIYEKGGVRNKDGRQFERYNSQNQGKATTELPSI